MTPVEGSEHWQVLYFPFACLDDPLMRRKTHMYDIDNFIFSPNFIFYP